MNLTWLELSACSLLALLKTDDGLTYVVRLAFVIPSFVTVLKITREGFVIEFGTENAEECEEAITQPLIDSACNDIQFYLRFCTSVYITNRNAPVLQLGITKIFYSNMNFQPISPSMPLFPEILKSPDAII